MSPPHFSIAFYISSTYRFKIDANFSMPYGPYLFRSAAILEKSDISANITTVFNDCFLGSCFILSYHVSPILLIILSVSIILTKY